MRRRFGYRRLHVLLKPEGYLVNNKKLFRLNGRRGRCRELGDECTRECMALAADSSLPGSRVAQELDRLTIERGKPKLVVSDNGTELTSNPTLI